MQVTDRPTAAGAAKIKMRQVSSVPRNQVPLICTLPLNICWTPDPLSVGAQDSRNFRKDTTPLQILPEDQTQVWRSLWVGCQLTGNRTKHDKTWNLSLQPVNSDLGMILAKPGALQQVPVGMRGARRLRHKIHTGTAPMEDGLGAWGRSDPAPAAQSSDLHKQGSGFPPNLEPQLWTVRNTSDKSKLRHILQNTRLILQYSSKPLRSLKTNKRQTWKTITIQRSWGGKTGERKDKRTSLVVQWLGRHCRGCRFNP